MQPQNRVKGLVKYIYCLGGGFHNIDAILKSERMVVPRWITELNCSNLHCSNAGGHTNRVSANQTRARENTRFYQPAELITWATAGIHRGSLFS